MVDEHSRWMLYDKIPDHIEFRWKLHESFFADLPKYNDSWCTWGAQLVFHFDKILLYFDHLVKFGICKWKFKPKILHSLYETNSSGIYLKGKRNHVGTYVYCTVIILFFRSYPHQVRNVMGTISNEEYFEVLIQFHFQRKRSH